MRALHRDAIADELAAFGNTIGGTLIFSVSDSGEVRSMNRQQMDALESFVSEICADSIRPPLAFITRRLPLPDGSSVLITEVEQSALVHKSPGGYLARQGSSKRELSSEALQRLFQQRGRSGLLGPDEVIIAETGQKTFEASLVDRFLSSRAIETDIVQLTKLGLMREDDNGILRATVAGILLCYERPEKYIRGAIIEAVRYRGTVLGRASQHDAATITGPLDRQIRDAVNFVRLNPILDNLDRMYLYATNIAINEGEQQPVHFKLKQPLRLTDINGFEWAVRFIEFIGKSALLEYRPPDLEGQVADED